jgi:hypothetical protein
MMGDKIKEFWHDQIPGWFPILVAIIGAAFWIGQQQQSINDRLRTLEIQFQAMQDYIRTEHKTRAEAPPIAANTVPQDASVGAIHY